MRATNPNLTPEDFDWQRKIQAATDAKWGSLPVPVAIAGSFVRSAS
jgi:hypothetical protein